MCCAWERHTCGHTSCAVGGLARLCLGSQECTDRAGAVATAKLCDPPRVLISCRRYDAEVVALRCTVEKAVLELVTGMRSTPDMKRALVADARLLAGAFGRRGLHDLLLPLLITCLNAGEGSLRSAFFGAVAGLGPIIGRESLDVFLVPCLEQVSWFRCVAGACWQQRARGLSSCACGLPQWSRS